MQIGQVIKKYRKSKNMTQEEMAMWLGVTAPAVNKWENGNSLPDIVLLAPIARLLDITPDILLSFEEELTETEIGNIIREADVMLKEKPYEEAFAWAKKKVEQYPNCKKLMLNIAAMFDGWSLVKGIGKTEKQENSILQWYNGALESNVEEIRTQAADSLYSYYYRNEQYEKAEEYLEYFSKQNPERKRKQAALYSKTGRKDEAYKAYEELLFAEYQMINGLLGSMYGLALQDENMEKAHLLVEKESELARVFEMGEYHEVACRLELAVLEKDVETAIDTIQKMLASLDGIGDFSKSSLYEHLTFKRVDKSFATGVKENLLKALREDERTEFLKNDERWQTFCYLNDIFENKN